MGIDLRLFHTGNQNYIQSYNGHFNIQSFSTNNIYIKLNESENAVVCNANGAVELYYDGVKKLETTSNGAQVNGSLYLDNDHNIQLNDTNKIVCGAGSDLKIYHDGNSRIQNTNNSCDFRIQSDTIELKANSADEMMLKGVKDGAVELYYNNDLKLKTVADGVELKSTGDVNLYLNADTDNSGEGDNPKIIFQQDGGTEHLEIGVEGPAGTRF